MLFASATKVRVGTWNACDKIRNTSSNKIRY